MFAASGVKSPRNETTLKLVVLTVVFPMGCCYTTLVFRPPPTTYQADLPGINKRSYLIFINYLALSNTLTARLCYSFY